MPNVAMTIPDIEQSVLRPIVYDLVSQIQDITKIDKKTKIFFPADTEHMAQAGSTIDDRNRDSVLGNNKILFIEVNEDFDAEKISSTAVTTREHQTVFNDQHLRVSLSPVYATSYVTISFKFRTQSKTEAGRWRDDMRMRLSQMRDVNLHDFTYNFMLPSPYLELLKVIHSLREKTEGYGTSFEEWVLECSTTRLTVISDLVNKSERLAISEKQTRIQGLYEFEALPEKAERESDTGTYVISFGYKFSYERPVGCEMKYPIIIHNELLPPKYVTFNTEAPDTSGRTETFTKSLKSLNHFEQQVVNKNRMIPDNTVYIPKHDEFIPEQVLPKTGTAFYALCTFGDDLQELLNLGELGDMMIDDDILDFIRGSEYQYITKPYRSILQLSLFRGSWMSSDWALTCDRSLNVSLSKPANRRIEHRIRFGIVTDLSLLDSDALDRLRQYPKAFTKIITCLNEKLNGHPALATLRNRTFVTQTDFQRIYAFLVNYSSRNKSDINLNINPLDAILGAVRGDILEFIRKNRISFRTVQVGSIIAMRK